MWVDVVHRVESTGRWSLRAKEYFACPYCAQPLRPRQIWKSRIVLLVGVAFSLGLTGALLYSGWLSHLSSPYAQLLLVTPMVVGTSVTFRVAKALVEYDKELEIS